MRVALAESESAGIIAHTAYNEGKIKTLNVKRPRSKVSTNALFSRYWKFATHDFK